MDTGLYSVFREHWNANGLGSSDPTPVFERLVSAYSEPARHYHTLQHLGECLEELLLAAQVPELAATVQIPTIGLALWFHDIVYDPHALDNEECSADAAVEALTQARASKELITQVRSLILATKTHIAADPHDLNTALLLDIDLCILGKPPERFAQYENQIRAEYEWVPHDTYTEKRGQILRGLMNRPNLFLTDHFKHRFGTQARLNLEGALESLG